MKDLFPCIHTGLTPAAAGISFASRQVHIPNPILIPHDSHPAPPGPYSNIDRSRPPHLSNNPGDQIPLYVPAHRKNHSRGNLTY